MKQLKQSLFVVLVMVLCCFQQVAAQQMPPIPTDPNVRIGKLSNGLTYYIRKNNLPEKRLSFISLRRWALSWRNLNSVVSLTSSNICVSMVQNIFLMMG
jgi:hypothetical protein